MMLYIMNDLQVFKQLPYEDVLIIVFVNYEQGEQDFLMKPITLYGVWLLGDPVFKKIDDIKNFIKDRQYIEYYHYYMNNKRGKLAEDYPYFD